ncbi:MAG: DTW domain-containing protein [Myxococcales bacterium]|nr:DTW domain-containing protein [Myxococcales bacterium]
MRRTVPRVLPPSRCDDCGLRLEDCLCPELPRLPVATRVVLLTHRAERRKSTNTGRLVARLLVGAEVRVRGERDDAPRPPLPAGRRLVLYPERDARVLSRADAEGGPVVLLVPDGNWNQARRCYRRDPDARGCEVVRLPETGPGRYPLRRGASPDLLCTLEAVARALGLLEGPAVAAELEGWLARFVERSLRAAGRGRGRGVAG